MVFAGVETHPRADRGKRIAFAVQLEGLGVAAFAHQRHKARHMHAGRAGAQGAEAARSGAPTDLVTSW